MTKTYNTPKRTHIVKTRLDDEEYAEFMRRMKLYEMSQAEFIREAISGATIRPTIVASLVNAVYVYAPDKSSGHRVQDVTISYNYIGILPANLLYDVMNGKACHMFIVIVKTFLVQNTLRNIVVSFSYFYSH